MTYYGKEELITASKNAKSNELFTVHDSEGLIGFCNAEATDNLCTLFDQGYMLQYGVYLYRR